MDQLERTLNMEMEIQSKLLETSMKIIEQAPEGYLIARQRSGRTDYYQTIKTRTKKGWENKSININDDPATVQGLAEKMLASKTEKICNHNLPLIYRFLSQYQSCDQEGLIRQLPPKYQKAIDERRKKQMAAWISASYVKAPFDPKSHIHETLCGELVRSKSEVIIANALFGYGIPFRYEERLPHPSEDGIFHYPDFTIHLPNGEQLIWEHLGMLSKMGYCMDNARKLHTYQRNDLIIGKNLILTQDDSKGNCSSAFTHQIIEQYIYPYFVPATS